jgi:hypothetical protein
MSFFSSLSQETLHTGKQVQDLYRAGPTDLFFEIGDFYIFKMFEICSKIAISDGVWMMMTTDDDDTR